MEIKTGNADAKGSVVTEPAVKTPEITIASPEATVKAIQDRIKARMASVKGESGTVKPEVKKPDVETTDDSGVTIPPKVLKQLGELQRQVRELEPKAKESDSFKPDAELARELRKLWSGTHEDKVAALAKLSGKDGLDTLAEVIHEYYKTEQDSDRPAVTPEMKSLTDKLDAAMKKIDALESGKTKEDEVKAKTATADEIARGNEHTKGFIERNKAQFELCARPENIKQAIEDVQDAALAIIEREKIEIKSMDQRTAEKVYLEALKETETEYENTGKRFSKAQAKRTDLDRFDDYVRPHAKPALVIKDDEPLSNNPDERIKQVIARNRAKQEAGYFRQ